MPKKCAMPIELAVEVLKKYISFFITDPIPEWSSQVWKKIAEEPEIKKYGWSLDSIRTNVRYDRRGLLTRTREEYGFIVQKTVSNKDDIEDDVEDSSDDDLDGVEDSKNEDYVHRLYKNELPESDTFDVVINRDLYNHIIIQEKKENSSAEVKLRPKVWTHVLACEFWKQFKLKCAFNFKKGEIHRNGRYYATVHGKCKSQKCKNLLFGYIDKDPGKEGPIIVHFQCQDTRFNQHEDVHRPLQGEEREKFRKNVKEKGVKGTRIQEAHDLLQSGDTQCPLLFSSNVLYQLKKESVNEEFSVKSEDRRDLIKSIINIGDNPIYKDCIIHLGDTPFSVFYVTPSQLHCYKEYRRIMKEGSSTSIDATGGVVRKFMDSKIESTSYIFLYQIVINSNNTTQPVYQMLSEIHDSDIIGLWLSRWLRLKVSQPKEVVCDGSRALLNATCLTFNKCSLSFYIHLCFQNARRNTSTKYIQTCIRLDTAHLVHTVSKWKCWNTVIHKSVKSFYLYCIGLLIDTEDFATFQQLVILIFIVFNGEYEDSTINYQYNSESLNPSKARKILEHLISDKNTKVLINEIEQHINITIDSESEKQNILNDDLTKAIDDAKEILVWINEVESHSLNITKVGTKLNCFYVPNMEKSFKEKLKEFPLWSKVCIKHTKLRATSSYVEESFKDIKEILKKQISLPARVDIFMRAHLKILIGGVKLFQAKLGKFIEEVMNIEVDVKDEVGNDDEDMPHDKSSYENWMGRGKDAKHKKFNWINTNDSSLVEINDSKSLNDSHGISQSVNYDNPSYENPDDNKENIIDTSDINEYGMTSLPNNSINEDHCYYSTNSPPLVNLHVNKLDNAVNSEYVQKRKNEGKYFKTFPDIKSINDAVTVKKSKMKTKKNQMTIKQNNKMARNLLLNGNTSGPINIKNENWFTFNTCPFDSIVQIIYNAALEDHQFFDFLKNSKNKTLLFVADFVSTGLTSQTCRKIYLRRFEILYEIYKNCELTQTLLKSENPDLKSLSRVINCLDNVNSLWHKLFVDVPSVIEDYLCLSATCDNSKKNVPVLTVNYTTLINSGLKSLEEAIIFESISNNLYCQKCKKPNLICTRTLNRYIYIELDIRMKNTEEAKKCKLRDLPKYIALLEKNLQGEEKRKVYRLSGVLGFQTRHYIAYCQSLSSSWQFFNDILSSPKTISPCTDITPHGVLYILHTSN